MNSSKNRVPEVLLVGGTLMVAIFGGVLLFKVPGAEPFTASLFLGAGIAALISGLISIGIRHRRN